MDLSRHCCACHDHAPPPRLLQVFVANPNKPQPIVDILTNNRGKLLKYLEEFHTDKGVCVCVCVCARVRVGGQPGTCKVGGGG